MKVICIKDKWEIFQGIDPLKHPKKHEICTVVSSIVDKGKIYYSVDGYVPYYCAKGFVPLDEYLDQFTGALTKELEQLRKQPCFTSQQLSDKAMELFKSLGWSTI
jgi:hypothetical protein